MQPEFNPQVRLECAQHFEIIGSIMLDVPEQILMSELSKFNELFWCSWFRVVVIDVEC